MSSSIIVTGAAGGMGSGFALSRSVGSSSLSASGRGMLANLDLYVVVEA